MALSYKENCPTFPGGQVLRPIGTIFELMKIPPPPPNFGYKIGPKQPCHYIHIAKNAPLTGGHVLLPIWTIFTLLQNIHKTNVLTKFHDDWAKNCDLLTVNCPVTLAAMFFQRTKTIFELTSRIYETNVLNKFQEDWTKNVTSRVFTCFHYIHIEKTVPPPTIFELVRYIYKTNVLTKFHDNWATIVTSRVFTRKTAIPTAGHVFKRTGTTFVLNQHIIKTNIFTNFELDRVIIGTNLLTKFHEDRTRNEASRVLTRKLPRPLAAIFELDRGIIGTNLLTKFYEDRTRHVATRVFTNKCGRTTDGRTTDKDRSQKLT
ncbi:hypothetical protein DPMN_126878 [Dreissena polymorpha]|uniref:Uncharacterized protein n=1 Tax=Dreissena polymorpha TaxID=45954 RepID=A0A9D4GWL9_DREPO|nr:hypothetical protein DPMN_126878 [Dreissena polymorpha]